jgi:glycosyltransferase involved in cell wall biosynthesis
MLSIIIPAHNEENRIGPTLEEYGKFFSKKDLNESFEILVVLNACKDDTMGIVKKYAKKFRIVKYIEFKEGGKGFAVLEGFKQAIKKGSSIMGFVDADMATKPEDFYDLYKNIGNADTIIASRWVKGAKADRTFKKYIRSRGFNLLVRILFLVPYRDTQCGAKIFRMEVIDKIIGEVNITRWAFDVNLLYLIRKKGFKIKEYPTIWTDKEGSKIVSNKIPIQMAAGIVRLRFLYSPLRDFIRLYDKMPEWIKFHHIK